MFGKKKEQSVADKGAAPAPVPSGVTFHVIPSSYSQATSSRRAPVPPPRPSSRAAAPAPMPSSERSQAPSPSLEAPPSQPSKPVVARAGGKKGLLIWGGIALVVIGGGVGILFLLPAPEQPQPVSPPSVEPVPEPLAPPPEVEQPAVEAPAPPEEVPPAVEAPAVPSPLVSSQDTDGDNLTDVEEAVYGTNPSLFDMDSDGYSDGQEVENLYNPLGTAPIRLEASGRVERYTNAAFRYSLLHPVGWTIQPLDATNREVLFRAATGEFIQVIVDENPEQLTALEWYRRQFPDVPLASVERVFIENMEGVWTEDRGTVYVTKSFGGDGKRLLYGLTYNVGDGSVMNFRTTFRMMLRSFRSE